MDWHSYDAALFDLDGVLTPTAEIHMRAWRQLFTDFLTKRGVDQPYLDSDYFDYIDGKPRYDGVRALLASRGIQLAEGDPSDGPEIETVCGLGNRKNEFFAAVLDEEGVQPYTGSIQLLDHLAERGTKIAVVTSSRNAAAVLEAADLRPRFGVVVDGNVAAEKGLRGKPSPDTFVAAAKELAYRWNVRWFSRMPSPALKPDMPVVSDSSLEWTAESAHSGRRIRRRRRSR